MEREQVVKAQSIFSILEPTLKSEYCRPHGENDLAVVVLDTLKPDDANALRDLIKEDLPYLTYKNIPSIRTPYASASVVKDCDIEIVTWNYRKLLEIALSLALVRKKALKGLREYILEFPQRAKVINTDVKIVFSMEENFFRWVFLLVFLESNMTLYLTDKNFAVVQIKQSLLEKQNRPVEQRKALIRFKQRQNNE